jgi:hypothetical protein
LVYFENVIYVLMFIPAVIVVEKYGAKISLIASVGLSIIGNWIALYGGLMGIKIVGQFIICIGFPLIISCTTKISAQWFPMTERLYATSFSVLAGMLGYALGDGTLAFFNQ